MDTRDPQLIFDILNHLDSGGQAVGEAIDTTHKIAVALADLHERNVIHRDLKPGNVLVDGDGRLLLSDLGLAATLAVNDFVRAQGFVGTPGYAAPEQFQGLALPQSDVFALGKILRELVLSRANGFTTSLAQEALLAADRLSMTDWRARPSAREAVSMLVQLLRKRPVASAPINPMLASWAKPNLSPQSRQPSSDSGLGGLLVGGAALLGLVALFSGGDSTWDLSVGRYRGADGRFKRG